MTQVCVNISAARAQGARAGRDDLLVVDGSKVHSARNFRVMKPTSQGYDRATASSSGRHRSTSGPATRALTAQRLEDTVAAQQATIAAMEESSAALRAGSSQTPEAGASMLHQQQIRALMAELDEARLARAFTTTAVHDSEELAQRYAERIREEMHGELLAHQNLVASMESETQSLRFRITNQEEAEEHAKLLTQDALDAVKGTMKEGGISVPSPSKSPSPDQRRIERTQHEEDKEPEGLPLATPVVTPAPPSPVPGLREQVGAFRRSQSASAMRLPERVLLPPTSLRLPDPPLQALSLSGEPVAAGDGFNPADNGGGVGDIAEPSSGPAKPQTISPAYPPYDISGGDKSMEKPISAYTDLYLQCLTDDSIVYVFWDARAALTPDSLTEAGPLGALFLLFAKARKKSPARQRLPRFNMDIIIRRQPGFETAHIDLLVRLRMAGAKVYVLPHPIDQLPDRQNIDEPPHLAVEEDPDDVWADSDRYVGSWVIADQQEVWVTPTLGGAGHSLKSNLPSDELHEFQRIWDGDDYAYAFEEMKENCISHRLGSFPEFGEVFNLRMAIIPEPDRLLAYNSDQHGRSVHYRFDDGRYIRQHSDKPGKQTADGSPTDGDHIKTERVPPPPGLHPDFQDVVPIGPSESPVEARRMTKPWPETGVNLSLQDEIRSAMAPMMEKVTRLEDELQSRTAVKEENKIIDYSKRADDLLQKRDLVADEFMLQMISDVKADTHMKPIDCTSIETSPFDKLMSASELHQKIDAYQTVMEAVSRAAQLLLPANNCGITWAKWTFHMADKIHQEYTDTLEADRVFYRIPKGDIPTRFHAIEFRMAGLMKTPTAKFVAAGKFKRAPVDKEFLTLEQAERVYERIAMMKAHVWTGTDAEHLKMLEWKPQYPASAYDTIAKLQLYYTTLDLWAVFNIDLPIPRTLKVQVVAMLRLARKETEACYMIMQLRKDHDMDTFPYDYAKVRGFFIHLIKLLSEEGVLPVSGKSNEAREKDKEKKKRKKAAGRASEARDGDDGSPCGYFSGGVKSGGNRGCAKGNGCPRKHEGLRTGACSICGSLEHKNSECSRKGGPKFNKADDDKAKKAAADRKAAKGAKKGSQSDANGKQEKSKAPCHQWARGECKRGDGCRFTHDAQIKNAKSDSANDKKSTDKSGGKQTDIEGLRAQAEKQKAEIRSLNATLQKRATKGDGAQEKAKPDSASKSAPKAKAKAQAQVPKQMQVLMSAVEGLLKEQDARDVVAGQVKAAVRPAPGGLAASFRLEGQSGSARAVIPAPTIPENVYRCELSRMCMGKKTTTRSAAGESRVPYDSGADFFTRPVVPSDHKTSRECNILGFDGIGSALINADNEICHKGSLVSMGETVEVGGRSVFWTGGESLKSAQLTPDQIQRIQAVIGEEPDTVMDVGFENRVPMLEWNQYNQLRDECGKRTIPLHIAHTDTVMTQSPSLWMLGVADAEFDVLYAADSDRQVLRDLVASTPALSTHHYHELWDDTSTARSGTRRGLFETRVRRFVGDADPNSGGGERQRTVEIKGTPTQEWTFVEEEELPDVEELALVARKRKPWNKKKKTKTVAVESDDPPEVTPDDTTVLLDEEPLIDLDFSPDTCRIRAQAKQASAKRNTATRMKDHGTQKKGNQHPAQSGPHTDDKVVETWVADLKGLYAVSFRGNRYLFIARRVAGPADGALFTYPLPRKTDGNILVALHNLRVLFHGPELSAWKIYYHPWVLNFDREPAIVSILARTWLAVHSGELALGVPNRPDSHAAGEVAVRKVSELTTKGVEEACHEGKNWDTTAETEVARHNFRELGLVPRRNIQELPPMPVGGYLQLAKEEREFIHRPGTLAHVVLPPNIRQSGPARPRATLCAYIGIDIPSSRGLRISYWGEKDGKIHHTVVDGRSIVKWEDMLAFKYQKQGVTLFRTPTTEGLGMEDDDADVLQDWIACMECDRWRKVDRSVIENHAAEDPWKCSDGDRACDEPEDQMEFGSEPSQLHCSRAGQTLGAPKVYMAWPTQDTHEVWEHTCDVSVETPGMWDAFPERRYDGKDAEIASTCMRVNTDPIPTVGDHSVDNLGTVTTGENIRVSLTKAETGTNVSDKTAKPIPDEYTINAKGWEFNSPKVLNCSLRDAAAVVEEMDRQLLDRYDEYSVWPSIKSSGAFDCYPDFDRIMLTRALSRKAALLEFPKLDWVGALAKEVKVLCEFATLGDCVTRHEANMFKHATFARLFMVHAVKHADLLLEAEARVRIVYGGHNITTNDGEKAQFEKMYTLPACAREIRTVVALALARGMMIRQFDVSGAYLHADISTGTFVYIDPVLEEALCREMKIDLSRVQAIHGRVWTLKRALYGHPLAGFLWDEKFTAVLKELGFTQRTDISPALFVRVGKKGKAVLFVLIYVDDGICCGFKNEIVKFEAELKKLVKVKVFEELARMLGCDYQISLGQSTATGGYHELRVGMESYVKAGVTKYREDPLAESLPPKGEGRRVDTPTIDPSQSDAMDVPGRLEPTCRSHIGTWMFGVGSGLPQIGFATTMCARHASIWKRSDDLQMARMVQYMEQHQDDHLVLMIDERDVREETLTILGLTDSDFAGDDQTRKSTSAGLVMLVGKYGTRALLSWYSRTQKAVATSTAEAELASGSVLGKALIETSMLVNVMLEFEPTIRFVMDSQAALCAIRAGFSKTMRTIRKTHQVSLAWIHEQFCAGDRTPVDTLFYIESPVNAADLGTKVLLVELFDRFTRFLGIRYATSDSQKRCICVECQVHPALMDSDGTARCAFRAVKDSRLGLCEACEKGCLCLCWARVPPKSGSGEFIDHQA